MKIEIDEKSFPDKGKQRIARDAVQMAKLKLDPRFTGCVISRPQGGPYWNFLFSGDSMESQASVLPAQKDPKYIREQILQGIKQLKS